MTLSLAVRASFLAAMAERSASVSVFRVSFNSISRAVVCFSVASRAINATFSFSSASISSRDAFNSSATALHAAIMSVPSAVAGGDFTAPPATAGGTDTRRLLTGMSEVGELGADLVGGCCD